MAIITLFVLATVAATLWIRRVTWRCRWEVSSTLSVALLGAAVLLVSSLGDVTVGRWLHDATGLWQAENFLGHICCLAGVSALLHAAVNRLSFTDAQLRKIYKLAIGGSAALYVPLLSTAFWNAQDALRVNGSFHQDGSVWLKVYSLVLCGAWGRLLWHLMKAMLILRHDPRSASTANIYLFAIAAGFGSCTTAAIDAVFGLPFPLPNFTPYALCGVFVSGFAIASARSWRAKTAWLETDDFKRLIKS